MGKKMWRMLMVILCIVGMLLLHVSSVAMAAKSIEYFTNRIVGNWLDNNGNVVLHIINGYINGCQVVDAFDFAGSGELGAGTFRIREENGVRDLRLAWCAPNKQSARLTIVNQQVLHKRSDYFYETVSGIHLGMNFEDVKVKWGEGKKGKIDELLSKNGLLHLYGEKVYYPDRKVLLVLDSGAIERIIILQGSKESFIRSRIGADGISKKLQGRRIMVRDENLGEYVWYDNNGKYVELNNYAF